MKQLSTLLLHPRSENPNYAFAEAVVLFVHERKKVMQKVLFVANDSR